MQRNVLFIGHANPEDNEFTLWIRQKLLNEGYSAECDLTILVGGENDYWKDIQECLEKSTGKYLLVLSHQTFKKPGVLDEWEYVRGLIKKYRLKDFILPLKIDNVSYNERIGLNRINIIDFSSSWALGLRQLIRKLEKDHITKSKSGLNLSIREWLYNKYGFGQGIEDKNEIYYSNWIAINNLPEKIYLLEYANENQAKFVNSNTSFPNIRHDRYIISFEEKLNAKSLSEDTLLHNEDYVVEYRNKKELLITDIIKNIEMKGFPNLQDSKNFLIRLLKDAFHKFMISRGLKTYTYTGSNLTCYYYEKMSTTDDFLEDETSEMNNSVQDIDVKVPYKVKFLYQERYKRKSLIGKYYDSFWHLGISINVKLFPVLVYEIKSHIVFSDDGINVWEDTDKLHRARRNKGKRFFNEHWRDFLFAFLFSLSDNTEDIRVPIKENVSILLPLTPLNFITKTGYKEPASKARLIPINELYRR